MDPHAAADRVTVQAVRTLGWCDVTDPIERAAALVLAVDRLATQRDRALLAAADDPQGRCVYATLAATLGCSRQAVRQRIERLRANGDTPAA